MGASGSSSIKIPLRDRQDLTPEQKEELDVFARIHPASMTCAHHTCAFTNLRLHIERAYAFF
jgi:hypothetical protein